MAEMTQQFYQIGIALAIGLLIGLERQNQKTGVSNPNLFGGVRTFPLLALTGWIAAMLGELAGSPMAFIIPLAIAGVFLIVAYIQSAKVGDLGMTTEIAGLLTVLIGAICYYNQLEIAAALSIIMLVLLSQKVKLHEVSSILTKKEIVSIAKFGLMTAIVLPILPDEAILPAPFDVLILKNIWLMVILVTALGMVGYFLKKFLGNSKAIVLTGFIGGLISSTAVSLTFSAKSREQPSLSKLFAIAIMVAWITMFIRVVVEVAVVNPSLVKGLWIPMVAAFIGGGIYVFYLNKQEKKTASIDTDEEDDDESPFSLKKSLIFGGLYAAVIVIANIAQIHFGNDGVYISAIAAGFTDVDAITLSLAEMSKTSGALAPQVAIKAITLAAVSNTLVKAVIVFTSAHVLLKKAILPGVILIVGAALISAFLFIP